VNPADGATVAAAVTAGLLAGRAASRHTARLLAAPQSSRPQPPGPRAPPPLAPGPQHACIRRPALRPDPGQRHRREDILASLHGRLAEARQQGWGGEVAGLEVSIAAGRSSHTGGGL
jgi:hypothetical protein